MSVRNCLLLLCFHWAGFSFGARIQYNFECEVDRLETKPKLQDYLGKKYHEAKLKECELSYVLNNPADLEWAKVHGLDDFVELRERTREKLESGKALRVYFKPAEYEAFRFSFLKDRQVGGIVSVVTGGLAPLRFPIVTDAEMVDSTEKQ